MNEGSSAESMLNSTLVAEAWASAELAMLVVDDDGHYIATNRSAEHLTGYTHHELLNLRAGRALAGEEDSTCIYQDLARRHTTRPQSRPSQGRLHSQLPLPKHSDDRLQPPLLHPPALVEVTRRVIKAAPAR
jgi:PAS domain-containing protein